MVYLGDYKKNTVVFVPFNTAGSAGGAITLAVNGTAKAYINGGITEITTGVTLVEDHDGITGRHGITVDTTGAGFTVGSDVDVCLDGATVDGVTVNAWVGKFSVARSSSIADQVWAVLTSTLTTVGSVGALILANLNAAITSRLASGTVAADVTAVKAKTDSLTFTSGTSVDANIRKIVSVNITGNGSTVPFDV